MYWTRGEGPIKGPAGARSRLWVSAIFSVRNCKDAQPAIEACLAAHPELNLCSRIFLWHCTIGSEAASYADCIAQANKPDAVWKFVGTLSSAVIYGLRIPDEKWDCHPLGLA